MSKESPSMGRRICQVIAAVLAVLTVPLAMLGGWLRVQFIDPENFQARLAPLASDADVQQLFADIGVAGMNQAVGSELKSLPGGKQVMDWLGGGVTAVTKSDAFPEIWDETVQVVDQVFVAAGTDEPTGAATFTDDGGIGIQLGTILNPVRDAMIEQHALAKAIPEVDYIAPAVSAEDRQTLKRSYEVLDTGGLVLPIAGLVLLALAIILARRRWMAVGALGLGIAPISGLLAGALWLGGNVLANQGEIMGLPASGLESAYSIVFGDAVLLLLGLALAAVLVGGIGLLIGRARD